MFFTGTNGTGSLSGTVNSSNPGGSGFSSGTNYSDDVAPDIIGKVAWDPGYGHYEAYGLMRFLHDRVSVRRQWDQPHHLSPAAAAWRP